jgi:hypothetical protein
MSLAIDVTLMRSVISFIGEEVELPDDDVLGDVPVLHAATSNATLMMAATM